MYNYCPRHSFLATAAVTLCSHCLWMSEEDIAAVVDAELHFRVMLDLPSSTSSYPCAAAVILRAPRLIKYFDVEISVQNTTREDALGQILRLMREHRSSWREAMSGNFPGDETAIRVQACTARAHLVLQWALTYDVAEGSHVLFEHVRLLPVGVCTGKHWNNKHVTVHGVIA